MEAENFCFGKLKKLKEELKISLGLVKYQILKFDANSVKTMKKTNKLLKLVKGVGVSETSNLN
jgi:hypothetical protein